MRAAPDPGFAPEVTTALSDYECTIEELVCQEDKAFAKVLFRGRHTGEFMRFEPTGKAVEWRGAANSASSE